jgi:prophage tail gpP-like protein
MPEIIPSEVILKIDGQAFGGWTGVTIERAINDLCSSFELSMTERWPDAPERHIIREGAACEVVVDGEVLMTGWIDSCTKSLSADDHSISVSGRDKTSDLIDCSAVHKPSFWTGQKLERIVADLIKPFGLKLKVKADSGAAFAKFALDQGESVFDAITRLCRLRGLLVGSDKTASVVIFKPTPNRARYSLELGRNIHGISVQSSVNDRFSDYIIKGQHSATGGVSPADSSAPSASAKDKGISRYRPLIIVSNVQSTIAGLKKRAAFEATAHMADSLSVEITMPSWYDETGSLFEHSVIVPVIAREVDVEADLMVTAVRFTISESEYSTALTLALPEAFTTEPVPEPKPTKSKKRKAAKAPPLMQ